MCIRDSGRRACGCGGPPKATGHRRAVSSPASTSGRKILLEALLGAACRVIFSPKLRDLEQPNAALTSGFAGSRRGGYLTRRREPVGSLGCVSSPAARSLAPWRRLQLAGRGREPCGEIDSDTLTIYRERIDKGGVMRDVPSRQMNQGDNRLRRRRHHNPSAPGFDPGPGHHGGPGCNGGGHGRGRRRGMRAQRGDVRAAVLQLLKEEPMHGYQLMQRITEHSEGAWRPSPGAVYPVLAQLEDEGMVEVTREQGRKLATLTDEGRAYVAEHAEELGDPFAALRAAFDTRVDLREPVEELASAARQLARSGSARQQEAARTVLREARRSLYLSLANDDADLAGTNPGE